MAIIILKICIVVLCVACIFYNIKYEEEFVIKSVGIIWAGIILLATIFLF